MNSFIYLKKGEVWFQKNYKFSACFRLAWRGVQVIEYIFVIERVFIQKHAVFDNIFRLSINSG